MKKILLIFLAIIFICNRQKIIAQNLPLTWEELQSKKVFTSLEEALKNPLEVYILHLGDNDLMLFPKKISKLKNLHYLEIGSNKLTHLPEEIGELSNLVYLYLEGNKLEFLPKEIQKMQNLECLSIYNNQFKEFPKEICNLKKLKILNFGRNNIKKIPKEIEGLENLTVLNFSSFYDINFIFKNRIILLPKGTHCYSLNGKMMPIKIAQTNNEITELPKEISKLKMLMNLDLRENNISDVEQNNIKKLLPNCNIQF